VEEGGKGRSLQNLFSERAPYVGMGRVTWWCFAGTKGGAMFVRTSRHRSGSSWTSPTCADGGGGRASTRVAGGDVENALFIFGRADTEAVGRPSESAQRQSYLVPPSLLRTHSSLEDRVHDRCPSPSHPPRASARPSPSAAMLPPDAAPASRYVNTSLPSNPSRDVEPTRCTSMHSCVHNIHPR
jgi:hypothetical protein